MTMLIALLAVLGVDLIVIVVLAAGVLSRRRWISRQPGAFRGAIRVADGELHGFGSNWSRGYGRWVRDVLVWTKGPLLFRNELVAVDGMGEERAAAAGEVKRLGDNPIVTAFTSGATRIEIAVDAEHRDLLLDRKRAGSVLSPAPHDLPGEPDARPLLGERSAR
jgi:hypothetical protein